MKLSDVNLGRYATCVPPRMFVVQSMFPSGHRAIDAESRLRQATWLALADAICAVPSDARQVASAIGEASKAFPYEGGASDASPGTEYARLVRRSRVAADMFRALAPKDAERSLVEIQDDVDDLVETGDAVGFQAKFGDIRLSRYPMWATFADILGAQALPNTSAASDLWLRLGLSPTVPRRMAAMWYRLPAGEPSYVPTICNANAGLSSQLNECFQPGAPGIGHGKTVRCTNLDAVDGFPEVVHRPVTGSAVTGIAARSG